MQTSHLRQIYRGQTQQDTIINNNFDLWSIKVSREQLILALITLDVIVKIE